jgi:hypothetical protein
VLSGFRHVERSEAKQCSCVIGALHAIDTVESTTRAVAITTA